MRQLQVILFTGVSGAGKTTALRAVEDLGFYCVDNLPLALLDPFMTTMANEPQISRTALVVDARLRRSIEGYAEACQTLKARGHTLEVVYLDGQDEILLRRFSYTRRRHPLNGEDLRAGLAEERAILAPLRARASTCIDTSEYTVHQLKEIIQDRYCEGESSLFLSLLSFGYRYGIPSHADLVFDVRFLPNPFFIEPLRELTGLDAAVADYVIQAEESQGLLKKLEDLLDYLLPRYAAEGKIYLTAGIGCTGGRHRSVAIAEHLGKSLSTKWPVKIRHRDVER